MDLKETIAAAKAEGMSYGEYVMKHDPPDKTEQAEPNEESHVGIKRICPQCGKTFWVISEKSKKKYCGSVCLQNASYDRVKQRKKEKSMAMPDDKQAETLQPEKRPITFGDILDLLDRDATEVALHHGDDYITGDAASKLWKSLEQMTIAKIGVDEDSLDIWTEDEP